MNIDDKLDQAARQLATEVAPQRDLWPGIEQAIRTPRRRMPWYAQAAAVVLLVGGSSGVTYLAVKDSSGPTVSVSPELVFERAAFGGDYHLGPGFQAARNSLRAQLDAELGRLSPEAQQDIQALHRLRSRCVAERTALCNQLRGLLAEYGIVLPQGVASLRRGVPELLEDAGNGLSELLRRLLAERWNPILDVFAECGVKFALEVHPAQIAFDGPTTRRALEALGRE